MTNPRTECELCGAPTDGAMCWECVGVFDVELAAIAGARRRTSSPFDDERQLGLATELGLAASRQTASGGNRGGRSGERERPLPVDLRAGKAQQQLERSLGDALEYVGVCPYAMGLADRATALRSLLRVFRQHRGIAGHVERIRDDIGRAQRVLEPIRLVYVGPCDIGSRTRDDACSGHLRAEPGAPLAECPSCGQRWDVEAVRAELAALAGAETLPAHDIARALTATNGEAVQYGTVRQWINRGKLHRVVDLEKGARPLYRVSDAQAILDAATRRNADRARAVAGTPRRAVT